MDEEINALTHRIIGLAMRVHTRLGPGLLEQAYKRCLCHELDRAGTPYQCEIDLPTTTAHASIAAIEPT